MPSTIQIELNTNFLRSVCTAYTRQSACPSQLLRLLADALETEANNPETASQADRAGLVSGWASELRQLALKHMEDVRGFYEAKAIIETATAAQLETR